MSTYDGGMSKETIDRIRFAVIPATTEHVGGYEVQVFVNEVEMTSRGAGMGMDPFELLYPVNLLRATPEPVRVPIARCGCGVYGCSETDVIIQRDEWSVTWIWDKKVPGPHTRFFADEYDAAVQELLDDHSWEEPVDTAMRLISTGLDHGKLAAEGFALEWQWPDVDADRLRVALSWGDYQVFLDVRHVGREVSDIVDEVLQLFAEPAYSWPVSYHHIPGSTARPAVAGPGWIPFRFEGAS